MSFWTEAKVELLRKMVEQGVAPKRAALALHCTRDAVVSQAARIGSHFKSSRYANGRQQLAIARRLLDAAAPPEPKDTPPAALVKLAEFDPLARRVLHWREMQARGGPIPYGHEDDGEAEDAHS